MTQFIANPLVRIGFGWFYSLSISPPSSKEVSVVKLGVKCCEEKTRSPFLTALWLRVVRWCSKVFLSEMGQNFTYLAWYISTQSCLKHRFRSWNTNQLILVGDLSRQSFYTFMPRCEKLEHVTEKRKHNYVTLKIVSSDTYQNMKGRVMVKVRPWTLLYLNASENAGERGIGSKDRLPVWTNFDAAMNQGWKACFESNA